MFENVFTYKILVVPTIKKWFILSKSYTTKSSLELPSLRRFLNRNCNSCKIKGIAFNLYKPYLNHLHFMTIFKSYSPRLPTRSPVPHYLCYASRHIPVSHPWCCQSKTNPLSHHPDHRSDHPSDASQCRRNHHS